MLSTGPTPRLILASQSAIRSTILGNCGVEHDIVPPNLDETPLKQVHADPLAAAVALARAKAECVSRDLPDRLVLGGDSIVTVDGLRFDKPQSRPEAAQHLRQFSGRSLMLTSAAALAQAGACRWSHAQSAILEVRTLSDSFIDRYLDHEWPAVAHCVGVFRLEGLGVHLFERIEGDHFTILGLPLFPLLGALRDHQVTYE